MVDRPTAHCQPTADLLAVIPESHRVNAIASPHHELNDPREQPISRYELWAIVAITLLGAAVRFAFPSAMAIEHFDEGVYASNLLFPDQGNEYPNRHLYAPSLVPALIEWSIILFGDKGIAPMLPSLFFGTLTIPLIWWVGRQWFSPLSGIAAATLLSLSDFHIAFSRSALTDVPLCFWLLLAVYLFERAFRDLSWLTAIAAGFTTSLAWWTKYNGWLPLAISLSGLLAWSFFASREERHFKQRLVLWGLAALTALAVWSPYWWSLPHGYGEVAGNHRQYVVGFPGWWTGFVRQIECQLFSVRVATGASWIAIFVLVLIQVSPRRSRIWTEQHAAPLPAPAAATDLRLTQAEWLLAAWFIGLTLTTPLYRPYPRLVLPWMASACFVMAWLFFGASRFENLRIPRTVGIVLWFVIMAGSVGLEFLDLPLPRDGLWVTGWQPRTALADLTSQIQQAIRDDVARNGGREVGGKRAIVYVFAEPGLFFHLPAHDLAVGPVGDLRFADLSASHTRLPTFLIVGPHADRTPRFRDEFSDRTARLQLIQSWPYAASDFVLLDQVPPSQLDAERRKSEVRLYRVRAPE